MKSAIVIAAALVVGGSAFAATNAPVQQHHGVVDTVKQDALQIGSAFRQDMHRIARGDRFRQEEAMDHQSMHSQSRAMGAGPVEPAESSGRQARMDAAYANWQRSHR